MIITFVGDLRNVAIQNIPPQLIWNQNLAQFCMSITSISVIQSFCKLPANPCELARILTWICFSDTCHMFMVGGYIYINVVVVNKSPFHSPGSPLWRVSLRCWYKEIHLTNFPWKCGCDFKCVSFKDLGDWYLKYSSKYCPKMNVSGPRW